MIAPEKYIKRNGLRILVVENEALVALQLEDILTNLSCIVIGPAVENRFPPPPSPTLQHLVIGIV